MLLRCLSLCRRPLVLLLCLLPMASFSLELKGELVQGGMLVGQVTPGEQVEVMGRPVRVDDQGLFVFGLGRDAPAEIKLTHTNGGNEVVTYSYAVAQRVYREQRVEGVPQKTVTPPPEVLERIRREATLVREARTVDDRRTDFLSGFVKPLEGPITGVYGSRRVYNGTPGNPHYGLDIAAPTGTEVFAPAPGVVTLVHRDMFYSGGTLLIDHGYGISSTFIHLSELLVEEGQQVAPGDPIARVGATGRATGPHLDWRINWFEVRLDPALVLEQFPAAK
ncbi:MAG: murein DD-endopeptidase MepM/ murein hydrolase activator NlpD [Porticoccus sp.]|jgi:murein DD-endopeptidase MepM/ murein hydrolase activator NlpD|uniref:M23 family metallopeptidase n=1 Tax=Porticoccus sp. TaxID=2024853 RepID=UPI0039E4C37F